MSAAGGGSRGGPRPTAHLTRSLQGQEPTAHSLITRPGSLGPGPAMALSSCGAPTPPTTCACFLDLEVGGPTPSPLPGGPGRAQVPPSLPRCEPGRGSGRGAPPPSAPTGAAWEPADAAPGAPHSLAPACETRHGPRNLLPVVSGRVLVGDPVPPGEVAVGAAGPHGPVAQGQLAGLQPCGRAGIPCAQAAAVDAPPLPKGLRSPDTARSAAVAMEAVPCSGLASEWQPQKRRTQN